MIFSRNSRRTGRHARGNRTSDTEGRTAGRQADPDGQAAAPARGPFDIHEAPPDVPHLDLGSLRIPAVEGVEVRVQADPDGGVQQVVLVHGQNALQVVAFAAPRTEGIWADVREEIRAAMVEEGTPVEEVLGEYGVELRARVQTPQGEADLRFVGVNGPRWMLRALYQGPAAVDPTLAGPLAECFEGIVVVRGPDPRPVREELPLRLPREMAEHAHQQDADGGEPG